MPLKRSLPAAVVLGGVAVLGALAIRCAVLLRQLLAHHAAAGELVRAGGVLAALVAVAAAAVAAYVARPDLRPNVALALGSAVAALYAGEVTLAVRGRDWRHPGDMLRTVQALRAQGRAAHPFVSPTFFISLRAPGAPSWLAVDGQPTLPLADIARSTVVACREAGEWLVFEADEHGFHNPPGMWSAPAQLAFVGDSFVHGSCVPSEANMVAVARRSFPATVNLGMPGGGPLVSLAEVREYLPALRPRTVVWCHYSGNDFRDLRLELLHPILRRYLEPAFTQRLLARQSSLDAALDEYVRATLEPQIARRARPWPSPRNVLALREVRQLAGLSFADPYGLTPTEEEFATFARVLATARAEVEAWGGRLVFAYLPASEITPRQLGEREYVRRRQQAGERTCRIAREAGLPVVDVAERFEREPDGQGLFACEGCHFSPRGYALAAQAILEAIAGAPR
jgi:GDSL-like lipase/acylhydrolase family protein